MNRKDKWLNRSLHGGWLLILLFFIVANFGLLEFSDDSEKNANEANVQATPAPSATPTPEGGTEKSTTDPKTALKVYSNDESRFVIWNRGEAVKFAFDRVASTINYLFLAASVLLGWVGKFILEPLLDDKKKLVKAEKILIYLKHTALQSLISICYGFIAYNFLWDLADRDQFSLYENIIPATQCQMFSLIFAAVILLIAIMSIVRENLKLKG